MDRETSAQKQPSAPVDVFVSCALVDDHFRIDLEKHFAGLRRQGLVRISSSHDILPGYSRRETAHVALDSSRLVLLLLSADFLDSDDCVDDVSRALQRQADGKAAVFGILVRACDCHYAPFDRLSILPANAQAVTSWDVEDEAWSSVVAAIRTWLSSQSPAQAVQTPSMLQIQSLQRQVLTARNIEDLERCLNEADAILKQNEASSDAVTLRQQILRAIAAEKASSAPRASSPRAAKWKQTLPDGDSFWRTLIAWWSKRKTAAAVLSTGLICTTVYGVYLATPCLHGLPLSLLRLLLVLGALPTLHRMVARILRTPWSSRIAAVLICMGWYVFAPTVPLRDMTVNSRECSYKGVILTLRPGKIQTDSAPVTSATVRLLGTHCTERTDESGNFDFWGCDHQEILRLHRPSVSIALLEGRTCSGIKLYEPPDITAIRLNDETCEARTSGQAPSPPTPRPGADAGSDASLEDASADDAGLDDAGLDDAGVDAGQSCVAGVQRAVKRWAYTNNLEVLIQSSTEVMTDIHLFPQVRLVKLDERVEDSVRRYEPGCLLFYDRYRSNPLMKEKLRSYLKTIQLMPEAISESELLKQGFTAEEVVHLRDHLRRFIREMGTFQDDPRFAGIRYIRVSLSLRPIKSVDVSPKTVDEHHLSGAQKALVTDLRAHVEAAATCE